MLGRSFCIKQGMEFPSYFEAARDMIAQSTFAIMPGVYVYAKLKSYPPNAGEHFMVTRDADEITVVTTSEKLPFFADDDFLERNRDDYLLISLNVSVPFYSVGFLATVGDAFARAGLNILFVSTYSKDYMMVRADLRERAREILLQLGFQET